MGWSQPSQLKMGWNRTEPWKSGDSQEPWGGGGDRWLCCSFFVVVVSFGPLAYGVLVLTIVPQGIPLLLFLNLDLYPDSPSCGIPGPQTSAEWVCAPIRECPLEVLEQCGEGGFGPAWCYKDRGQFHHHLQDLSLFPVPQWRPRQEGTSFCPGAWGGQGVGAPLSSFPNARPRHGLLPGGQTGKDSFLLIGKAGGILVGLGQLGNWLGRAEGQVIWRVHRQRAGWQEWKR